MKRLGVVVFLPEWDAIPWQGYSTAINLPVPIKYLPGWLKALPEQRIQLSSLSHGSTLDIQCTLLGHSPFSRKPLTQ